MAILRDLPSMYQLLPPQGISVVLTSTGKQLPATAPEIWLESHHTFLETALAVHAMLEKPLPVPIKCIYANNHETPWCYKVNGEFRVTAAYKDQCGDGTVIAASAFEGTEETGRRRLSGEGTAHDELPCNGESEEILRSLVAQIRRDE
jgi:hypothetical protein